MRFIVAGRGAGASYAMVHWLLGGHPVKGWPGWSRILVLPHERDVKRTYDEHREVHSQLWNGSCVGGLGKVLLSAQSLDNLRGMRGLDPSIELAVDGYDLLDGRAHEALRGLPVTLASVSGEPVTPQTVLAEATALTCHVCGRSTLDVRGDRAMPIIYFAFVDLCQPCWESGGKPQVPTDEIFGITFRREPRRLIQ